MGTGRKWLLGCGIGCAVVLGFGALLTGGTVMLFKNAIGKFRVADRTQETLVNLYGSIDNFTPAWDGTIAPERLEKFLQVREQTAPERAVLEQTFGEDLPAVKDEKRSPRRFLRGLRLGVGITGGLASYMERRNAALLDAGMGIGEYAYIYVLAYYSWLDEDPGSGPSDLDFEDRRSSRGIHFGTTDSDWEDPETRRYEIVTRVNAWLRPVLTNQLAAIPDTSAADVIGWRTRLQNELQKLEDDKARLPWQDGLPAQTSASLEPYRDRLLAQWSPMTNMLELIVLEPDDDGGHEHRHRRDRGDV